MFLSRFGVLRRLTRKGVSIPIVLNPKMPDVPLPVFTVNIGLVSAGTCTYAPPVTEDCQADSVYELTFINNTLPAPSAQYAWQILAGAAIIVGADDQQQVTIRTDSDSNKQFILRGGVTLSDLPNVENDVDTKRFTHTHTDNNEPPVFIGPDAIDLELETGVVVNPLIDFSALFTGTNLMFVMDPAADPLPGGLTLSSVGLLAGTPNGTGSPAVVAIKVTNSKGEALSNLFTITIF